MAVVATADKALQSLRDISNGLKTPSSLVGSKFQAKMGDHRYIAGIIMAVTANTKSGVVYFSWHPYLEGMTYSRNTNTVRIDRTNIEGLQIF